MCMKAFWVESSNFEFWVQTQHPSRLCLAWQVWWLRASCIVQARAGTGQAVRNAPRGEKTEALGGGGSSGRR